MLRTITKSLAVLSVLALLAPACSSKSGKTKGGGEKGAAAATANQKAGGTAKGDQSKADDKGVTYEEVTCDDSHDGLGWCDSETEIIFCAAGHFYALDCSTIGGDFCGDDGATIDCYAAADF